LFPSSRNYDPGCSFLPIPNSGSRDQKGIGFRIRILNTGKKNLKIFSFSGLRSPRIGEQSEAIVRFPRLLEKYPFPVLINTALLKLAEVFRQEQQQPHADPLVIVSFQK
jgi:hypothetical protein